MSSPVNTLLKNPSLSSLQFSMAAASSASSDRQEQSPLMDEKQIDALIKRESQSLENLKNILNHQLTKAVKAADLNAVKALFSNPLCTPSPHTIEQEQRRAALFKPRSFGDLSEMSAEYVNWATNMGKIEQLFKSIVLSSKRAATSPPRLVESSSLFTAQS